MLSAWDPFRELDRVAASVLADPRSTAPMDAFRRGDDLVLELDLPGIDPASIDLTVEKRVLEITATRDATPAEGDTVLFRERPHGRIVRRVRLNEHLDTEALAARYEHGVLTVTVPVREAAKPRRVPVMIASNGASAVDTSATEDDAA